MAQGAGAYRKAMLVLKSSSVQAVMGAGLQHLAEKLIRLGAVVGDRGRSEPARDYVGV
jgi:hypothetical protein